MKTYRVEKQPDGSWKSEWVEAPYPDPIYESLVQQFANGLPPGFVACGAQKFEEGKDTISCDPQAIDLRH